MAGLLTEIYEQPQVIHQTLDALSGIAASIAPFAAQLAQGSLRRVVLTGMGSSFWAAYPCALALGDHKITALPIEASELLYYHRALLTEDTLVVAISQSGRSVEVVKLLDELDSIGRKVPVLGITNDPESQLAQRSTERLMIQAGAELTVSSKTYTCTLVALHLLSQALLQQALQPHVDAVKRAADAMGTALPGWTQRAQDIAAQINPVSFLIYVGRGPSRASAMTAALITKETVKLPTEGMVAGQFRHGPMEVVGPGITSAIFAGPGRTQTLNLALARDLVAREGHTIVIGGEALSALNVSVPAVDEMLSPILEIVPVQLLAAQLAALRGLEVGAFRYGQKVTTTE